MVRWLRWTLLILVAGTAVAFAGDWAAFRLHKSPASTVTVHHFLATPLKNNKQELDYLGSEDVPCSRSLFPQAGMSPCWYLQRHRNQSTNL